MSKRKSDEFNYEGDVKAAVKKLLKAYDWWHFMPKAGPYGVNGIPDFICCRAGRLLAIETKVGSKKPTELQKTRMQEIRAAGGIAVWVNEDKLGKLEAMLKELG